MYISRYHFKNDKISLSLDSKSGELLELIDLTRGDNLIKSHEYFCPPPFCLCLEDGARITPPRRNDCISDGSLSARIAFEEEDGSLFITVCYDRLIDNMGRKYETKLIYTIKLTEGSGVLEMNMTVEGCAFSLSNVLYPYVAGVWLGESYEDDVLVYPFNGGIKMNAPIRSMSAPRNNVNWRWQEYRYVYNLTGMGLSPDQNGYYNLNSKYSGPLSMAYLDMYDENGGIFVGFTDECDHTVSLLAQTKGEISVGMNLAVCHTVTETLGPMEFSGQIMLHDGDWHTAADYYRRKTNADSRSCPKWFDESLGLAAHYDFKYQNGSVVHKYSDIPRLVAEAAAIGLDHLLFAGWHKDGFDNGFPQYYCDDELGTFEELKTGLEYAHKNGMRVSFYINSRLANTKYEANKSLIESGCIRRKDQTPYIEKYGDDTLSFATMCAASTQWQEHLGNAFDYILKAGADGIYFDQIGMAPPLLCYSESHGHGIDDWAKGCKKLISLARNKGLNVIIEGCSDMYGSMVGGQLISTFSYIDVAFPELFRYTFPNQMLVDMVYPKHNLAMRPVFVANKAKQMIDTAVMTGMYIWAYDLEFDNTFRRDEETLQYLKAALKLRRSIYSKDKTARFDDNNLVISPKTNAKCFKLSNGIAVAFADTDVVTVKGRYVLDEGQYINNNELLSIDGNCVVNDGDVTHVKLSCSLGVALLREVGK